MGAAAPARRRLSRPRLLRPRARTRARVLAAARAILRRDGYRGLTMERVAAESGAAKTTLYRRWPTRAALCMDLYLEVAGHELRDPDTGDVGRDLERIADTVVRLQTRTVAGPAFVGLIAEAQLRPETRTAFLAEFAGRRRELTRRVLRRAVARGELRAGTDVDLVIDALGGAVTFRLLQGHAPLSRGFTRALVGLVLSGCRAARSPRRRPRKQARA
jgi:AcrR family transcriptional regulator